MVEPDSGLRRFRFLCEEIATRAEVVTSDTIFPYIDALAAEAERLAYALGLPALPLQPVWYQRAPDGRGAIEYDPESSDYDPASAEATREPVADGLMLWMYLNNVRDYYTESRDAILRISDQARREGREKTEHELAEVRRLNDINRAQVLRLTRLNLQRVVPDAEVEYAKSENPRYLEVFGWRLYDPTDWKVTQDIHTRAIALAETRSGPSTFDPWESRSKASERTQLIEAMDQWVRWIDARPAGATVRPSVREALGLPGGAEESLGQDELQIPRADDDWTGCFLAWLRGERRVKRKGAKYALTVLSGLAKETQRRSRPWMCKHVLKGPHGEEANPENGALKDCFAALVKEFDLLDSKVGGSHPGYLLNRTRWEALVPTLRREGFLEDMSSP